MNYLLDTNCFIFSFNDKDKIPPKIQEIIQNPKHQLYLSIISLWEISIKAKIKKLQPNQTIEEIIQKYVKHNNIIILPINTEDIFKYYELKTTHKDLFDLLIMSQSLTNHLTILTSDHTIRQHKFVQTLW